MKRIILQGAFYSPNSSEGRWAWNIARVLDAMASWGMIELDLFLPDGVENHYFYNDFAAWKHFTNARFVRGPQETEYDVLFLIQPGNKSETEMDINDGIRAKKRVVGVFELYWYGYNVDRSGNLPDNTEVVYALEPHHPDHQKWPTKPFKRYRLPYTADFINSTENSNWASEGVLLMIKSPIHGDFSDATTEARIDHFRAALDFAKAGVLVTVGYANRLYVAAKDKYVSEFLSIHEELKKYSNVSFVGNVSPLEMQKIIFGHSVVYTGKLNEVLLYSSFCDALNYGSVPIIWNDWPEQFFRENVFEGWSSKDRLMEKTDKLFGYRSYFNNELEKLRSNIKLHTLDEYVALIEGILHD